MELSGNLHRFADFIQARQRETGSWRGTVSGGTTTSGGGSSPGSGLGSGATGTTSTTAGSI
jgi:hypothetical protein